MNERLLSEIDKFLAASGLSGYRFGLLAVKNGRLVERLRAGGRVWPETEAQIRAFIISRSRDARRPAKAMAAEREATA